MWNGLLDGPPVTAGQVIALFVVAGAVIAVYKWMTGGFQDADSRAAKAVAVSETRIMAAIAASKRETTGQIEKLAADVAGTEGRLGSFQLEVTRSYLTREAIRELVDPVIAGVKDELRIRFDALEKQITAKRTPRVTRVLAGKSKRKSQSATS